MRVALQVVGGQSLPDAPYPPDTRVRGWKFQFDHERLNQSDTWAVAQPDQRPWLLMLWLTAWQQVPAGSMSADDQIIAAKIGMESRQFAANKDILLRGWVPHRDGRLYHPVIVEQVLEYLDRCRREKERKAKWRDKMADVPRDRHGTDVGKTLPEPEPEPINTHASHESPKNSVLGRSPVPFAEIREAWIEALPTLTRPIGVEHWTPNRKAQIAARWRDQLPDIDAWRDLFRRIYRSDFLMGRSNRPFRCDLFWVTKPENLLKIYEGKYDNASTASR